MSSESALSSEGSEGEGSEGSLGIALRLRPTLPKKQPTMPRFSPAAAWRQLASLDAHLAAGNFLVKYFLSKRLDFIRWINNHTT